MMLAFPLKTEVPRVRTLHPLVTAAATDLAQSFVASDIDFATIAKPTRTSCVHTRLLSSSNLHHSLLALLLLHPLVDPFARRADVAALIEAHGFQLPGPYRLVDLLGTGA